VSAQQGALHFDIVASCRLRCMGCPSSTIASAVSHIAPSGARAFRSLRTCGTCEFGVDTNAAHYAITGQEHT